MIARGIESVTLAKIGTPWGRCRREGHPGGKYEGVSVTGG
jgi:hypothetical protein